MAAQLDYSIAQAAGFPGGIYDANGGDRDIVSRNAEGAVAFGIAVSRGTDPDSQCSAGGTAATFLGISVRDVGREGVADGSIEYDDKQTVGIMRSGYIWALSATGCVPGDPVAFNGTSGVLDTTGLVTITGAHWDTTAAAGELGLIRIHGTAAV